MSNLKLWFSPGACSLAPHILLREAGADFQLIHTDLQDSKFHLINPKKKIPVLSLDENIITETPAIITAVSNLSPEKHLLGKTPLDTARSYEWLNYLSGVLQGKGYLTFWRPGRFSDDPDALEGIKAKGKKTIIECYEFIEEKLSGVHAVGDSFTGSDAYLYVLYRWGKKIEIEMESEYPKYTALAREVEKRDTVVAAVAEEKVPFMFSEN